MKSIVPGILVFCLLAAGTGACFSSAQTSEELGSSSQPAGTISPSVRREVHAAINRGLDWLAAQQRPNGAWSNTNFPALTALPLQAFLKGSHRKRDSVTRTALEYILPCVQPDGGIYRNVAGRKGGGLSNYNTAICAMALHAAGNPGYDNIILKAREFMAASQHLGDDIYKGGFGYDRDTKRAYTDLLNTYYTTRAMRETQDVEDRRAASGKPVDIEWDETVRFIERLQNKPGAGPEDAGGFFYNPTDPKAGTTRTKKGVVVFRSYGSITYAGLLALIYAELDQEDPRVRSAFDWAFRHWSLEENPGMGQQGLFFFYNVLTRALTASGHELVPLKNGKVLNWREDLAGKLVSLQKIDPETGQGYWVNETGRYWENDPVLVTAYCLLALEEL